MAEMMPDGRDEHIMSRLQEIVPELRRDIEESVRNRLLMKLERAKQSKRSEIQRLYQQKLEVKIEEANTQIKDSLSHTLRSIETYKRQKENRGKQKIMNEEEERDCIEQTVEEILSDERMVGEVRSRMRQRLQIRVRADLQHDLEEEMEKAKRQLIGRLRQEREMWTEERIDFWKRQSDLELEDLAAEHNELNNKKASIEACLTSKKAQKWELQQRLRATVEQNALVASLRSELKTLKSQIH